MVPGLNDLVYVMGVGQCATHVVPVAPNALSRRTYPTGKLGRCGWWVVILFVEDGAVGWSCKCSSGRHCRRIGGHQTTTWRLASCSLSRGHNLRLASPGARIQAARGLEFCVLGIVVHLRLGNCIGYSLREHEWQDQHAVIEAVGIDRRDSTGWL